MAFNSYCKNIMSTQNLTNLAIPELFEEINSNVDSWDYTTSNTKYYTHCYHSYPAMMIPQIASRLLEEYALNKSNGILFDPFCGTGTTLVEGIITGMRVIGTDLNPLARLIAKTKCTLINLYTLRKEIDQIRINLINCNEGMNLAKLPDFKNIKFWFNDSEIIKLSNIKYFIDNIKSEPIKNFLLVAFSETVRESSLTKVNEFKLVRKSESKREQFKPNVIENFLKKLERNYVGLESFSNAVLKNKINPLFTIEAFNTVNEIPEEIIKEHSVDIVITSPPYGDSSTTVAYGQFSRLSNQWLGIDNAFEIDKILMGGKINGEKLIIENQSLNLAIERIEVVNLKRAKEVQAFYVDLNKSCQNIAKVVKKLGFVCYVVSNRRVQGMELFTDLALIEFYEKCGFTHIATFRRNIPNKRMPLRNSPTNVKGMVESTMTKESIIILQKTKY